MDKIQYLVVALCLAFAITQTTANICAEQEDGTMLPNPNNCGGFYICDAGLPWALYCPGLLVWNDHKKECDFQVNVDCGDRPIVEPTQPPATEAPAS
uniref:Putative peritrophin-like protein 3 ctenocephalides felis n=1 Tax=Xenopsylla cheopis TaxID=163159 RepID=A0A6M2DVH0_XENCH